MGFANQFAQGTLRLLFENILQYISRSHTLTAVLVTAFGLLFHALVPQAQGALLGLLPLFALGGCGDSGGDSGGDGGGAGCGCGQQFSTPFLCTWDGNKYQFENDVLFGKPRSAFADRKEGLARYEAGEITPDLYRIQNESMLKNGRFVAQLKEIEPEESFIDHLSLVRVAYPDNAELIVDSNFLRASAFYREDIESFAGIEGHQTTLNEENTDATLGNPSKLHESAGEEDGYFLDAEGGFVEVKGRVVNSGRDVHLLLRAHYRDWSLGELMYAARKGERLSLRDLLDLSPRDFAKGALVAGLVLFVSAVGSAASLIRGNTSSNTAATEARTLASAFRVPHVHADTPYSQGSYLPPGCYSTRAPKDQPGDYMICPYDNGKESGHYITRVPGQGGGGGCGNCCSLHIAYWDENEGVFVEHEVYAPRHCQPTINSIALPKEAIQKNGEVKVRIRASKRHKVHQTILIAPEREAPVRTEEMRLAKAYNQREERDYAGILNEKRSGEYLHTIPGDVVTLSFDVEESVVAEGEQHSYLMRAGGVYTGADESAQGEAGDWISRLDGESRKYLKNMYTLKTYNGPEKRAVLTR